MNELEQILRIHAARYPGMQPRDAVKLVYQNEFGGGHLIRDRKEGLARLQAEYASVSQRQGTLLAEDVGNGLVRIQLNALDHHGISPEILFDWFAGSAAAVRGQMTRFQEKLVLLDRLAKEPGIFSFSGEDLRVFLKEYEGQGFPPVSHSKEYHRLYTPAYRIVLRSRMIF